MVVLPLQSELPDGGYIYREIVLMWQTLKTLLGSTAHLIVYSSDCS
jgi:hypothetical protein